MKIFRGARWEMRHVAGATSELKFKQVIHRSNFSNPEVKCADSSQTITGEKKEAQDKEDNQERRCESRIIASF